MAYRFRTMAALWVAVAVGVPAQSAPEPGFSLIGDVAQGLTGTARTWDAAPTTAWSFTFDLKPRFTYGTVTFVADSSFTAPLDATLNPAAVKVVVPEAYFRVTPIEGLDLTFGQKRFNLGVGQTFTVGDTLNPAIGFFDQKTGFRGATAEWSPASWASFSAAASTEGGSARAPVTGAGQVTLLLERLQVTASVVGRPDATLNPALGLSYDWAGVILTAEGAVELQAPGDEGPQPSASAGARYTADLGFLGVDADLTLAAEYLHWALGTRGIRGEENAFFRVALEVGSVSVGAFAAVDLGDRSVLGQATASFVPWDNFELEAGLQGAHGSAGSSWEFLSRGVAYQTNLTVTYHF